MVNTRLYKYYWIEMQRSICGGMMVLLHYIWHQRVCRNSQKDIQMLCSFCWTMVRMHNCVTWRERLHLRWPVVHNGRKLYNCSPSMARNHEQGRRVVYCSIYIWLVDLYVAITLLVYCSLTFLLLVTHKNLVLFC